ncbi:MAG: YjgN family protein [Anaerolineae bacterium]|nr:YjgN family protein [Anaerolineae bacterium]MDW8173738.1 hypothetical protein [Anaerolineae bacterium]
MTRPLAFIHALIWYGLAFLAFNIAWPVLGLFSLPYLLGNTEATERARLLVEHALYGQVPVDFLTSFLAGLGWAALMTLMVATLMGSTALWFARQPRRMRTVVLLVLAIGMLGLLGWIAYDASGRGLSWMAWVREGCPRPAVNSAQIILTCGENPRGALDNYEAILIQSQRLLPVFMLLCAVLGLGLMVSSGRIRVQAQLEGCQRCGLSGVKCLLCQPRLQLIMPRAEVSATVGQPLELPLTIGPVAKLPMPDVRLSFSLPRDYRLLSDSLPQGWSALQTSPPVLSCDLIDTSQELRIRLLLPARQWRRRRSVSLRVQAETPFSYDQPSTQCLIRSERAANWAERLMERLSRWLGRFMVSGLKLIGSAARSSISLMRKAWNWLRRSAPQVAQAIRRRSEAWWRSYRDRSSS